MIGKVTNVVQAPRSDLREAMIALHDKLANLELDLAEATIDTIPDREWLDQMQRLRTLHDTLAQFYDLDVYLDREPVQS